MPEFHEDHKSRKADPVDAQVSDFDWNGLYASLGEDEVEVEDVDYAKLAQALHVLLSWVLKCQYRKPQGDAVIGRRFLAMAWAINPSLLNPTTLDSTVNKSAPSLSQLAKQLNITKAALSSHAAQFHRDFGIANRGQKHGWNFTLNPKQDAATRPQASPKAQDQGSTAPAGQEGL